MADEHYFSARPSSEERPRTIRVTLAGRDLELRTQGGVFSPERLDSGTAVLLSHVPAPPTAGAVLDLGCGWGPIAIAMKGTTQLRVQGCAFGGMFCGGQTWTRVN